MAGSAWFTYGLLLVVAVVLVTVAFREILKAEQERQRRLEHRRRYERFFAAQLRRDRSRQTEH